MSKCIYLAAQIPVPEVKNPHYRMLSINEAAALGMKIPDVLDGIDRNKPEVMLWSDAGVVFDIDAGTVTDAGYDDDFSFRPMERLTDFITEMPYCAEFEMVRFTEGRAWQIIAYVASLLEKTDEVELWNVWLGLDVRPRRADQTVPVDALTPEILREFLENDTGWDPPVHHCLRIVKSIKQQQ